MKNFIRILYSFISFSLILLLIFYQKNHIKYNPYELNLFVWADFFHKDTIKKFEKEYNATINLYYYSSNEELIVKLKETKCRGYDLIFPSDYAIKALKKEKLLQALDKTALNFMSHIDKRLLNQQYDLKNQYALPYLWEIYGIGINTQQVSLDFS